MLAEPATVTHRRALAADRWLATRLQRAIEPVSVRLQLWDGSSPYSADAPPVGDIVVRDRWTLLGLALNPDLWFGEAYMKGRLDIHGSRPRVVEALSKACPMARSARDWMRLAAAVPTTLSRARRNVHHHYDLGNDFYQRWLDSNLVYTCAYFPRQEMSLDEAQRAKLDLICRKLRLQSGETVIEAGCGWGALALHMARYYDVRVRAFNVSREQLAYARDRARHERLTNRVEFIDDDYRNVTGECDVFVSIGMVEHVGRRHLRSLASVLQRTVRRSGGRGLLHFIGRDAPRPLNAWIRRRIFPGAYPPTLAEVTTSILQPAGMSVIDVENLRLHYALTLAHWYRRFADAASEIRAAYGEEFQRCWELYLAGSQAAFTTGWMQLFQVVFAPAETPPPYWTRSELHTEEGRAWSGATP
jgi:cyclopropane-fatty-acyl-phospholipid synthase